MSTVPIGAASAPGPMPIPPPPEPFFIRILSTPVVLIIISPVLLESESASRTLSTVLVTPPTAAPTPAEDIQVPLEKQIESEVPVNLMVPFTESLSLVASVPMPTLPVVVRVATLTLAPSSSFLATRAYATLLNGSLGDSTSLSTCTSR